MDAETLAALKESIRHWEDNVKAETPGEASTGATKCALCLRFHTFFGGHECVGCPVYNAGHYLCRGTPYEYADMVWEMWQDLDSAKNKDAFREAAQAELNFLRSLLPEGEQ